jgi:DNA-binding response OmpR family regulator
MACPPLEVHMAKILLVEEYEAICNLLTDEFNDLGHEVWTASSRLNLLDLIRVTEPDLVILSIDYYAKNWGEMLFEIKRYYYNLPIIILSSYYECKAHPAALAADYVVIKSSDFSDLTDKVSRGLQSNLPLQPGHGLPYLHPGHLPAQQVH